nr:hypothetical protein BaRGS_011098 [Batillaria attramentaria]
MLAVKLRYCNEGGFMKVNNSSPIIYADLSTDTPSTVSWTLESTNGKKTDLDGPDGVDMQYWSVLEPNGTITVIVSCNAVGSNPVTMDMITWGGLCQGQKGFNCTLRMPEVDGKEVTCVATNAANNGHAVTASVLISGFTLGQSEASGFWNRDLAKGMGTMLEATTTGAEPEGAYEIVDSRV